MAICSALLILALPLLRYSMLRLNKASRYDLAAIAVGRIAKNQPNHAIVPSAHMLSSNWQHELRKHEQYTVET